MYIHRAKFRPQRPRRISIQLESFRNRPRLRLIIRACRCARDTCPKIIESALNLYHCRKPNTGYTPIIALISIQDPVPTAYQIRAMHQLMQEQTPLIPHLRITRAREIARQIRWLGEPSLTKGDT